MIEVRCCCDGHLIGWMQGDYVQGRSYRFALSRHARITATGFEVLDAEELTFECKFWGSPADALAWKLGYPMEGTGPALQSRDYPIEQLRRIATFREVTHGEADGQDQSQAPGGA